MAALVPPIESLRTAAPESRVRAACGQRLRLKILLYYEGIHVWVHLIGSGIGRGGTCGTTFHI